jgi:hypothetical protein
MEKEDFYSRLAGDEITAHGIGCYLYKVYNYHDSHAYGYKWSRILF